jgi:hypothetical protein
MQPSLPRPRRGIPLLKTEPQPDWNMVQSVPGARALGDTAFSISSGWWVASLLFVGMLVMLDLGRRFGERQQRRHGKDYAAGLGSVEGALFGLLGLLVAFTFSGAASRFDDRRALIVEEANDIGTAYLRIDLLPVEAQPAVRQKFREYADARIAAYASLPDIERALEHLARANELQAEIWRLAVPAAAQAPPGTSASVLMLNALNAMFDITNTRTWATQMHPPVVVFLMLATLALGCALIAGHGMSAAPTRNWLYMVSFALLLSSTVFVIIDLEYPRLGLFQVAAFDRALVDVRKGME